MLKIQIYHGEEPSKYIVVLEFADSTHAKLFYKEINYIKVSPFELDFFIVANLNEQLQPCLSPKRKAMSSETFEGSTNNCSICLESLNFTDYLENCGQITVLCGHMFHLSCLSKFSQNICPLCRSFLSPPEFATCTFCNSSGNLWMCLVCGDAFCGDDLDSANHREDHFKNSKHRYMKNINKRKMIYDCFKKQNMVDLAGSIMFQEEHGGTNEKIGYLVSEYNSLINSQIESQREYYETIISKLEAEFLCEEENLVNEINRKKVEIAELEYKIAAEKENETFLKEFDVLTEELNRLDAEIIKTEEDIKKKKKKKKKMSKQTEDKVAEAKKELSALTEELQNINEETKDMHFHLNNASKFKKNKY